ncbi:MAG TPA: cytochrome c biogenesis protein CcsA [Bryobacteraceae bacterium]|nr:cytochrome c biogenesis protein CcsA [Bryobacteraceae bacterium]
MGESSVIWLRVAAGLYSLGLIDAVITVLRRSASLFRIALGAFAIGALFQLVSIVEQGLAQGQCPVTDIFETMSFCAFIITVSFLAIYYRYKAASLSVFIFPLVFVMTLVGALRSPVSTWTNPSIRNAWLITHIVFALLGYAALLFTAAAAVVYLVQERQLKRKTSNAIYKMLPPLGTLDELISKSLGAGFAFITIGIVIGSIWAFVEMGTRWIGESSIAISFVTWAVYLALVFFRVSAGWRGRKTAILSIVALLCCLLTWVEHAKLGRFSQ